MKFDLDVVLAHFHQLAHTLSDQVSLDSMKHFTLEWPVSVDRLYRPVKAKNAGSRFILTERARTYKRVMMRQAAAQGWRKQGIGKDLFALLMVAYPKDNRVGDLDNLLKVVIDGLQMGGVVENDNQQRLDLVVMGGNDKKNPRVEIYLLPL